MSKQTSPHFAGEARGPAGLIEGGKEEENPHEIF
jgi:hypothetical protein